MTDYLIKYGQPPTSTAILFEPYYESWGIYHTSRHMPIAAGDSPGDYDVNNADVGDVTLPDSAYDRLEFESYLREAGQRLAASIEVGLKPTQLAINLDYDWVCAFTCD